MFENGSREARRSIREQAHALKHAIKQAEHDKAAAIREAERAQARAISQALNYEFACTKAGLEGMGFHGNAGSPGPVSVEAIVTEADSYISYLEDLPKEKVAPFEAKLDQMGEHLKKLRESFHK